MASPHFSLTSVKATTALSHTFLSATLYNAAPKPKQDSKQGVLTFILDKSASMRGQPLNCAKEALIAAIPRALQALHHVYLIAFDEYSEVHYLSNRSFRGTRQLINDIAAGRGTNFAATFEALRDIVEKHPAQNHSAVFLSDGCDMNQLRYPIWRDKAIAELKEQLSKGTKSCQVHSLGFRPDHDASLLTALTTAGTSQGTFVYAAATEQINVAVDDIFSVSTKPFFEAPLVLRDADGVQCEDAPNKLKFESDDGVEFNATVLLSPTCKPVSAEFDVGGEVEQHPLEFEADKWEQLQSADVDNDTRNMLLLGYAVDVKNVITTRICQDVAQIPFRTDDKKFLRTLRHEYESFSEDVFTRILPQLKRNKEAKGIVFETLSLIKDFYNDVLIDVLRHGAFENHKYAQLASVAFGGVRNRKIQNVLDKRAARNLERLDNIDERVARVVGEINFDDPELFADIDEYGRCVFSTLDYKQAMRDGDCLCLGLEIQRPEAAVVDPSRLIVKNVGTTLITTESFLNAVQYRLRPDADEDETNVHGGFAVGVSGTVLTGQSREIINAALPLFINEEHWRIAKIRRNPLFGWMATLDVLGFSHEQVTTIPFLVLRSLRENPIDTEYGRKVERWVMQTCIRILEESTTLNETLFKRPEGSETGKQLRYLTDPTARLPDVVPNHDVFCYQLHVAMQLTHDPLHLSSENIDELGKYIIIEEVRRRLKFNNAAALTTSRRTAIEKAVGFSPTLHFDRFAVKLSRILERGVSTFEECMCKMALPAWNPSLLPYPSKVVWHPMKLLHQKLFRLFGSSDQLTETHKLAISVLHLECPRPSDVRSEDYEQEVQALLSHPEKFLKKRFDRIVELRLRAIFEKAMNKVRLLQEKEEIREFLEVDDIDSAAGMLSDRLWLGRNVGYYANGLSGKPFANGLVVNCSVRQPLKKICLLVSGTHSGINLYSDQDDRKRKANFDGLAWKPRKRHVRQWFKRFAIETTEAQELQESGVSEAVQTEWKQIFPWHERELGIWSVERKSDKSDYLARMQNASET